MRRFRYLYLYSRVQRAIISIYMYYPVPFVRPHHFIAMTCSETQAIQVVAAARAHGRRARRAAAVTVTVTGAAQSPVPSLVVARAFVLVFAHSQQQKKAETGQRCVVPRTSRTHES